MLNSVTYWEGAELPDIAVSWGDSDGNLIDFSTGYTFTVKIGVPGSAALVTKTTGVTGSATDPNLTITWEISGEVSTLPPGRYALQLVARRTADSKDRVYPDAIWVVIKPVVI